MGRTGFTLLEMLIALTVAGVLLAASVPSVREARDRLAVRGAREAVVGFLARARARAVSTGGARVVLEEDSARLVLWTEGLPSTTLALGREFAVALDLPGAATSAELRYDAVGVGRLASRTLRFRRGAAEAALTVSSYGRVRRP